MNHFFFSLVHGGYVERKRALKYNHTFHKGFIFIFLCASVWVHVYECLCRRCRCAVLMYAYDTSARLLVSGWIIVLWTKKPGVSACIWVCLCISMSMLSPNQINPTYTHTHPYVHFCIRHSYLHWNFSIVMDFISTFSKFFCLFVSYPTFFALFFLYFVLNVDFSQKLQYEFKCSLRFFVLSKSALCVIFNNMKLALAVFYIVDFVRIYLNEYEILSYIGFFSKAFSITQYGIFAAFVTHNSI